MSWTARNLSDIPGITHGFLGIDDALPVDAFYCRQQHTAEVVDAPTTGGSGVVIGDGGFTDQTRPVAVLTADCLPLLIASTDGHHVAAVHGGWKGLQAGILGNVLARFAQAGVAREDLRMAIGPSIKACCYEVSADFIDTLEQHHDNLWPANGKPWRSTRLAALQRPALPQPPAINADGAWFDLSRYAELLLAEQGIEAAHIEVIDVCTCCHTQALGSYRRRTHWPAERTQQFSWVARV